MNLMQAIIKSYKSTLENIATSRPNMFIPKMGGWLGDVWWRVRESGLCLGWVRTTPTRFHGDVFVGWLAGLPACPASERAGEY